MMKACEKNMIETIGGRHCEEKLALKTKHQKSTVSNTAVE